MDQTFQEFYNQTKKEYISEYEITEQDFNDMPIDLKSDWFSAVMSDARSGKVIAPEILDDVYNLYPKAAAWKTLWHDFPKSVPTDYLNPGSRTFNQNYDVEMKTVRGQ